MTMGVGVTPLGRPIVVLAVHGTQSPQTYSVTVTAELSHACGHAQPGAGNMHILLQQSVTAQQQGWLTTGT